MDVDDSDLSSRTDNPGDDSNLGGDDDDDLISNYALYDGYESYNEVSDSSDGGMDDDVDTDYHTFSSHGGHLEQKPFTEFRFINGKDGMATCEMCGSIGVKHAFYSKSKRFCSLTCSRSFSTAQKEGKKMRPEASPKKMPGKSPPKRKPGVLMSVLGQMGDVKTGMEKSFDWNQYLLTVPAEAGPVSSFKHCAMYDSWDNIGPGMKVELVNQDCDLAVQAYWIASVIKTAGYKALMRYEGYAADAVKDFWIHVCDKNVHPVGWCASMGKPLVPPKSIQHKYADWKDFLVKRLTGARTLPTDFHDKVAESIANHKFRKGMKVEVVDKNCVSAMRVATIEEILGGRLKLQYTEKHLSPITNEDPDEFWCHMRSDLLHPVGWSQHVGHKLHATLEYKNRSLGKIAMQKYDPDDARPDMFRKLEPTSLGMKFQVGMKLEAIDPLNLSSICVATVMKVLRENYMMIGIDGSIAQNDSDWFCFSRDSPCLFPAGFCEINNIPVTQPRGHKGVFRWFDYLKVTRTTAAQVKLFDKAIPKHGFKPGMKVEAVDLMEPRLLCVATITKVVGRLLRIHFDGWENEYDQWVDCESPDFYPVGWCELHGHKLEGPRTREANMTPQQLLAAKKRRGKTQIYRGPRKSTDKKRKAKLPNGKPLKVITNLQGMEIVVGNTLSGVHRLPALIKKEPLDGSEQIHLSTARMDSSADEIDVTAMSDAAPPILSPIRIKTEMIIKKEPVDTYQQVTSVSNLASVFSSSSAQYSSNALQQVLTGRTLSSSSALTLSGVTSLTASRPALAATLLGTSTTSTPLVTQEKKPVAVVTLGTIAPVSATSNPVRSDNLPLVASTGALTGALLSSAGTVLGQKSSSVAPNIPCLIPNAEKKPVSPSVTKTVTIHPETWRVHDVCQFLRVNDCGMYCESFTRKKIDGQKFLSLSKEHIVNLTGMKVGPSLKIFDLIQLLKTQVAHQGKHGSIPVAESKVIDTS